MQALASRVALCVLPSPALAPARHSHRISIQHLNAISRPHDLAALLEAYAGLGHASVAVPELLAAASAQLLRQAAAEQEGLAGGGGEGGSCSSSSSSSSAVASTAAPGAAEAPSLQDINSILSSHLRLGYAPPPLLLQALQPSIMRQLAAAPPAEVAQHLRLLVLALTEGGYRPGATALRLMLVRLEGSSSGSAGGGLPEQVVRQARRDAAILGG